jgi:hypothetical protein
MNCKVTKQLISVALVLLFVHYLWPWTKLILLLTNNSLIHDNHRKLSVGRIQGLCKRRNPATVCSLSSLVPIWNTARQYLEDFGYQGLSRDTASRFLLISLHLTSVFLSTLLVNTLLTSRRKRPSNSRRCFPPLKILRAIRLLYLKSTLKIVYEV